MRTPKQKTSAQKRYEQLKSRGLCVACGKVPAQPGKTKCVQCGIKTYGIAEEKHYKTMYEGLLYGDPKMRILRILWTTIYNDHNARIKEEQNHGKH